MVDWVSFGLNTLIPILIGLVVLLSLALYAGVRRIQERVPSKEEMMDMGYAVLNTVANEKIEEFGLAEFVSSPAGKGSPVAPSAGRPGEGLLGKLMWFAENTAIGRNLSSRFLGGGPGGGGGGSPPQDYYG